MDLKAIEIDSFELGSGERYNIKLTYQVFGQPLHTAPIVLVNHALTGNSNVAGDSGWWKEIIGSRKVVDTGVYTVLAFNIPGNGFCQDSEYFTKDYFKFRASDIARAFIIGLDRLQIGSLYAIIGGSVGGGLVWEMAKLRPQLSQHLIPVASDWKSTDWLVANCYIQDQLLNNSTKPVEDARRHAMTFYRTPESLNSKFKGGRSNGQLEVESWLNHHGRVLDKRFSITAYRMLNQILKSIKTAESKAEFLEWAQDISGNIHIITINSDLLFKSDENWNTFIDLKTVKDNVTIGEIKSIHGHDAFLIEYQQLTKLLKPIFQYKHSKNDNYKPSYIRHW